MNQQLQMSPSERAMWEKPIRASKKQSSPSEINEKYEQKEQRIVTEYNREKLPNFVESLKRPNYMNLQPFYQRRPRWDAERQSRLIESFIANIPVPPLFVYETEYNSYEVMDGQQRITAISQFYSNLLTLENLKLWPELNGFKYGTLPEKIRAGIDRRSISYIVLLKESAETEEEALLLKRHVFERLNTGGVKLAPQEIRNALFQGKLNSLLLELAQNSQFRQAWGIPKFTPEENKQPSPQLLENTTYTKMADVEVILRFFALRHVENYQRGMKGFLDLYMARALKFNDQDLAFLRKLFEDTMRLASEVFGDHVFRPFNKEEGKWADQPQKAFSDAVMIGIARHLADGSRLLQRRDKILIATKEMFLAADREAFTGGANSKKDVEARLSAFDTMLREVLG